MSLTGLITISKKILAENDVDDQLVSPLPGLFLLQSKESPKIKATVYDPVICLIIQGCKEVTFGD
ncbi:AraC family transcriptional regulator, partial [bacterium]|nr:AraC family transcriptional regulator [bacterium]